MSRIRLCNDTKDDLLIIFIEQDLITKGYMSAFNNVLVN
jgi:hypothetical protein